MVGSAVGVPYTGATSLPGYNSAKKSIVYISTINNRYFNIHVEEKTECKTGAISNVSSACMDISLHAQTEKTLPVATAKKYFKNHFYQEIMSIITFTGTVYAVVSRT